MASPPRIVLASTSPWRRQLLQRLQLPFTTAVPDFAETAAADESPETLVGRLSRGKAASVATDHPDSLIIGSDQVAALDQWILGKPGGHERAVEQLRACSGREVIFHTGLCLQDTRDGSAECAHVPYRVRFRPLADDEIERYLHAERPYDCAGSIRSEGYAVTLFEEMSGPDPSALIGLPLITLTAMLRRAGITLP